MICVKKLHIYQEGFCFLLKTFLRKYALEGHLGSSVP